MSNVPKEIYNDLWNKYDKLRKEKEDAEKKISVHEKDLDNYIGVTSAVFARGILEDFLKRYLRPYISVNDASGIEASYIQFLADANNGDSVRLSNMIANRITSKQLAANCRSAYQKLSRIVHVAQHAYRNLHGHAMFINVLFQVPRLTDSVYKRCMWMIVIFHWLSDEYFIGEIFIIMGNLLLDYVIFVNNTII